LSFVLATSALAAEYAVLHTGFRLRAEHHEVLGDQVRLHTAAGGTIDLEASAISHFEADELAPAPGVPELAGGHGGPPLQETVEALIDRLGGELGLHPALIHSIVAAESAYRPDAVSSKGAVGLMQLMPETARELQVEDRRDPAQNLRGGTSYLKQLLERYAGKKDQLARALAAYNAGPEKVDRYDGLPPYNETRLFVGRVIQRFLRLTENAPPVTVR
jgi:soluble lytic murein transglycosylase-like protein